MENKDLIFELENGREINVLLVAEEKYFMNLAALSNRYRNLNIKAIEKSHNYMHVLDKMNNIDIIINYNEKKEDIENLGQLERLSFNCSTDNHRVTVGYAYCDSCNDGFDSVVIVSSKDGIQTIEEFEIDNEYTPFDLLQITLNKHDNLEKVKTLKRS